MASSLISLNLKSSIENRAPCGNACGVSSPLAQKGFREGHSRRLWGRRTLALEMEVQQEEEERGGGERGWKLEEAHEEAMWKVERGVLRENRHHEVWRWRPKSKIFLTIMFSLQLRPTMSNRDNSSYMEE